MLIRSIGRNISNTTFPRHISFSSVLDPLPASYLRGGTSKGIYINRDYLPKDRDEWTRIFLGIMGSPDAEYGRMLNGMGGNVSSLSKICVVGAPSATQKEMGADVEYTFCQVGIREPTVDYSGNCGNLSSMIGVFALDEKICRPRASGADGRATVRAFNTNTNKLIDTTFPVDVSDATITPRLNLEETTMAGVPGKASRIVLDFINPEGARTEKLLPSGSPVDTMLVNDSERLSASLVDATNPTVFILDREFRDAFNLPTNSSIDYTDSRILYQLESVRKWGAERMGLDPNQQAQPKIAILSPPSPNDPDADIVVHALSMGVLHKAVPMTVGLCLGVAARTRGTVASDVMAKSGDADKELVRIRHPGGIVEVGAEFGDDGRVRSAKVVRTGRRLMKGVVWW